MDWIIRVENFRHVYPDGTVVNIESDKSLEIERGEKVAILGANGSGKTTLLSTIMGFIKPQNGSVKVAGLSPTSDFDKVRKKLGVILQNCEEQIIGPRVYDDIAFTLRQERVDPGEIEKKVYQIAALLGIEDKLQKIPHYLSGGEKQKVALAGALAHDPEILILDEPLDSLDAHSRKDVEELLNYYNNEKKVTILITTHDVNWVSSWADTIYLLSGGKVIDYGKPQKVLVNSENLLEAGLLPPVLVRLFKNLQEKGYQGEIPLTLEEAEEIIDESFYFK